MSEPPRPPGAGDHGATPPDPTAPMTPPGSPSPGEGGYYPPPSAPQYEPPTAPISGGGYPPAGGGYPPADPGYQPPADPSYPPAGGGYPPPGGYDKPGPGYPGGAPGYPGAAGYPGTPTAGYGTSDEKTWALVAHFGGALGALLSFGPFGFVAPLIAFLAKGQQSPTVRAHALAALNFQIVWSAIAFVLLFVSWCLLFLPSVAVVLIQIIFGIIAGLRANEGRAYRYPMSMNLVK